MSEQSANLIGQLLLPVLQTCCKKLAKCINVYLFLELCFEILTIHYGADVEIENVYSIAFLLNQECVTEFELLTHPSKV